MDLVYALKDYGISVTIFDPWANPKEVYRNYGLTISNQQPTTPFDAVVLGVAHQEFLKLDFDTLRKDNSVLYDVKGLLGDNVDGRL